MKNEYNIKLDRCNYYEREWIGRDIKIAVSKKTDNKCAMCGKHIKFGDNDFTIDHFIPLNKGGNNDISNLIPLCKKCNEDKQDDVIHLGWQLPFLKNKYKKELMRNTRKFLHEYIWLNKSNILMFDDEIIHINIPVYNMNGVRKNKVLYNPTKIRIQKVKDLTDEIVEFIEEYNKYYNIETWHIRKMSEEKIKNGCMYIVRKVNNNKLLFVFYFDIYNSENCNGQEIKMVGLSNIICKPDHNNLVDATRATIIKLVAMDLESSYRALDLYCFDINIEFNSKEENYNYLKDTVDYLLFNGVEVIEYIGKKDIYRGNLIAESEEGFKTYLYSWYTKNIEKDISKEENNNLINKSREIVTKQLS